ncbi:DNA-3-methyladenine glycosylase I [Sarracenia purpurea var. burkii]
MSVATELPSPPAKPESVSRAILGPAGNGIRVPEETKRKKESSKRAQKPSRLVSGSEKPRLVVRSNSSVDSAWSSDSSSGGSSGKMVTSKRRMKTNEVKTVKVVPDGVDLVTRSPTPSGTFKRCDWITPNSGKSI